MIKPYLADGAGPVTVGWDHDITSKSKIYKSLKNYFPFQPPKISILVPLTKLAEWPNLAEGAPDPLFGKY